MLWIPILNKGETKLSIHQTVNWMHLKSNSDEYLNKAIHIVLCTLNYADCFMYTVAYFQIFSQ